ncbi:MAG: hypothetical protein HDQ93_05365 [Desulfovibrio sp.]|nr:hypothetical protein [Desulfovibrio sp.]
MTVRELKAEILKKFASVHAFCKAHPELPRASVYLLLSGKYPAKDERQIARIIKTLNNDFIEEIYYNDPPMTPAAFCEELQKIRCANCRKLNRRECLVCRDATNKEGLELFFRLYGRPKEQS